MSDASTWVGVPPRRERLAAALQLPWPCLTPSFLVPAVMDIAQHPRTADASALHTLSVAGIAAFALCVRRVLRLRVEVSDTQVRVVNFWRSVTVTLDRGTTLDEAVLLSFPAVTSLRLSNAHVRVTMWAGPYLSPAQKGALRERLRSAFEAAGATWQVDDAWFERSQSAFARPRL